VFIFPEPVTPLLKSRETTVMFSVENRKKRQKPKAWAGKISVEANIDSRNKPEGNSTVSYEL